MVAGLCSNLSAALSTPAPLHAVPLTFSNSGQTPGNTYKPAGGGAADGDADGDADVNVAAAAAAAAPSPPPPTGRHAATYELDCIDGVAISNDKSN
eukprot:6211055-Pleurochrysis_carterae.AAC.2